MNYETKVSTGDVQGHGMIDHADAAHGGDMAMDAPDEQDGRKRRLWIAISIIVVLSLIAAYMLSRGDEAVPFAPSEAGGRDLPVVTVSVPGSATLQGTINATGTLAARREMPVGVVGEGGRVVSVSVEAGNWVNAGQVLAVIDRSVQNQQLGALTAQIDVAQADADLAQANLNRAMQLVERGFISQADIDRLTATRDAAVARVQVARAQLAERSARNAQLNIVAPAAGLLLARNVEPGQVVSPGSGTLFSIARGGEMELLALVGETELGLINIGATGTLTPAGTNQTFTCQVWQKAPVIDEQTRQGTARCALPYDPALRPGGFATISLVSDTSVATRLPESAIFSDDAGSYVYIVDAQDTVVRRPVEVGGIGDAGITITSGLNGTERVVMLAGGFLTEGDRVRPVTEASNEAGG